MSGCAIAGCIVRSPRRLCHYHARSRGYVVPGEEELGQQRWCYRCQEWWPLDADFWQKLGTTKASCRACQRESGRRSHAKLMATRPEHRRAQWRAAAARARGVAA